MTSRPDRRSERPHPAALLAVGLALIAGPTPSMAAAPAENENEKDVPRVSFPWRSDKPGNVMLLQRLVVPDQDGGKARTRESVVRVIPAAKVAAARVKPAPSKLAKVRRRSSEWHVQKDGSVALLQRRVGTGQDGKPARETALVARIPPGSAGSFAGAGLKPPAAGTNDVYWSRGSDGEFVLYQGTRRLPVSRVSAARLRQPTYLDRDDDGRLEDDEVYSDEDAESLDELDQDDDAGFDDDDDDFDDDNGDGLDDDDDGDDDADQDDGDDDDNEDGDLDDDGDDNDDDGDDGGDDGDD